MAAHKSNQHPKQLRRQAARTAKREEQRLQATRRRRRSLAIGGVIALAAIAATGLGIWSAVRPKPGEPIASQGATHIARGQPHPAYNSNPPTSGWHTPQVAAWGTLRSEVPDEFVLHNLEHGGIWISYKDPNDGALVEKLEGLASRNPSKIIVTPRQKNDSPIAVAAWGRLLKLNAYDERTIVEFVDAFRNRGPERVP